MVLSRREFGHASVVPSRGMGVPPMLAVLGFRKLSMAKVLFLLRR
jgi:hypothetical protein